MTQNTCLNCTKRYRGCHSVCEDYKLYKEYLDKIRKKKELEQIVPTHNKRRKVYGRK